MLKAILIASTAAMSYFPQLPADTPYVSVVPGQMCWENLSQFQEISETFEHPEILTDQVVIAEHNTRLFLFQDESRRNYTILFQPLDQTYVCALESDANPRGLPL
jgi:hypothetical protein